MNTYILIVYKYDTNHRKVKIMKNVKNHPNKQAQHKQKAHTPVKPAVETVLKAFKEIDELEAKEIKENKMSEEKKTKEKNQSKEEDKESIQSLFQKRLQKHHDELRWLYMELYDNSAMFAELCDRLEQYAVERHADLRALDQERENKPDWYKQNNMLGMMLYIDNFAGTLKGVESKLDYLEKCHVNYIHLMPFLDTVEGRSDGGYAVADFRKVQENLGTMEDLENLTKACHQKNMSVCMDFVMNHTSEDHEWAKKARQGDGEYMSRYFFFDNHDLPEQYEKTVPQVFPTTAPGNFTWIEEVKHYVMTTFYPYQWDLNYRNPRVFNEMMYNFLYLANQGIDIMRLDAVPYIWKTLGTPCRNLKEVHSLVRMMRMVGEIVCPGVLLLGEVVMEPEKVVPYFGTVEKPECHMLYNVTTMATTWHTVATRDASLLKKQLDTISHLPKEYVFLNYLRCHDDIGWGLDFETLAQVGQKEYDHKNYLNDYFRGLAGDSNSRGELYNADPVTGDARFCATTASMCGIEKAIEEKDEKALEKGIDLDIMLHAYMFMQSGIPVLYSGDEVGQLNDYTYHQNPHKAADSRYLHRGVMSWEMAQKVDDLTTPTGKLFSRLSQLEAIRQSEKVFVSYAKMWVIETGDRAILGIGRSFEEETLIGLFNFSENEKTISLQEEGDYIDLISKEKRTLSQLTVPAYGFYYLKQQMH